MPTTVHVAGLLVTGAGSALLRKVLFQMQGLGLGGVHGFVKPWLTVWMAAIACAISLPIYAFSTATSRHNREPAAPEPPRLAESTETENQQPLLAKPASKVPLVGASKGGMVVTRPQANDPAKDLSQYDSITWQKLVRMMLPANMAMASLIVQGMGLRYVSVSVSQMISGSCIVFTALMARAFLGRQLNACHLGGIVLSLAGIGLVSISSLMVHDSKEEAPAGHPLAWFLPAENTMPSDAMQAGFSRMQIVWGIVLTLLSQVIQAAQFLLEELMLTQLNMHSLQLVGWRGIINLFVMTFIALPVAYFLPGPDVGGRQENTLDSIAMLANTPSLVETSVVYMGTVTGTNVFGLLVAAYLGSTFRAVLLTTRTALVWAIDLALWWLGGGSLGEPWTRASWIELAGFLLLIYGTIKYAQGNARQAAVEDAVGEEPQEWQRLSSQQLV